MKYLKVWTSFREVIEPLNDAEKGRLFDAMLLYADHEEEPVSFEGNERFVWPAAKQSLDLMFAENLRLKENGRKGGRPKSKENQTEPTKTNENQTKPNETQKEKKRKEKETNEKESPSEIIRRFTPPTLQEVADYCRERKNKVDPERFVDFYASKGWKVGNQPMKDWKAAVRTWERSETDRKKVTLLPAQDYHQRDYTGYEDEALERMLKLHEETFGKKVGGA